MNKIFTPFLLACFAMVFTNCSKQAANYESDQLTDYLALQPGKYIIYKLDSTVKIPFNDTGFTVRSYQAKDLVDQQVTDNLGRPSWRVIRYLRDTASSSELDWKPNSTYLVTATRETVDVVENNLRYQKLTLPISEGFSWKGNSHIDTYSLNSEVRYLFDWDYYYENTGMPFTLNNTAIANTITVNQRDEMLGVPNNPDSYGERTFSKEVYAKGVGLVYKDFLHWVYQPRNSTFPFGSKDGYGIRMQMIRHN